MTPKPDAISRWTDAYFNRTRGIVEKFGDSRVRGHGKTVDRFHVIDTGIDEYLIDLRHHIAVIYNDVDLVIPDIQ